jgi:hypothetical protein
LGLGYWTESAWGRKLAVVLISRDDAVICGIEVDAMIRGVELSTRSHATSNRAMKLNAVSHGVDTCYLDAMNNGVDPRGSKVRIMFSRGPNVKFLQKRVKLQKIRLYLRVLEKKCSRSGLLLMPLILLALPPHVPSGVI